MVIKLLCFGVKMVTNIFKQDQVIKNELSLYYTKV